MVKGDTNEISSYLPTDASTFFMRGVPILSAFTGSHTDYHTPRDTPDKLNYEAAAKIARGSMARCSHTAAALWRGPKYAVAMCPPSS